MRRFGDTERFLELLDAVRALAPRRRHPQSNVIVGFPGETEADVAELERFLTAARLDVVGVFGYSDEDGTEAAGFDGKLPTDEIADRVERVTDARRASSSRSAPRTGSASAVDVLVEEVDAQSGTVRGPGRAPGTRGRRQHHGDRGCRRGGRDRSCRRRVVGTDGADLVAERPGSAPLVAPR